MRVAEISGGVAVTLRVKSTGEPFRPVPSREDEVALVRSGDQTLLRWGTSVWSVRGVTPQDTTQLTDVVSSGLPLVAYLVHVVPDALVIEARRFTQELRIAEAMQIGLDDKVMDDVRRGHKVGGTGADVAGWLEDRLLMPAAPGDPREFVRVLISGDGQGRLDAFRIYGLKVAADIRRIDDKLRIERVVRGGKSNQARLMLLSAQISVVDATVAAELHSAVRTTLSEAVAGRDSYLRIWQEYHEIERQSVLRRARTFGALAYGRCERRRDGGWCFHLQRLDDLSARLALLGEWDRFELEAGEHAPELDQNSAAGTASAGKNSGPKVQRLTAQIIEANDRNCIIDLRAPDEDDEQPKPPISGFLYLSTAGDEARLRRRERAEEALRTGNCPLPQLGLLMEGRPAPAARRGRIGVDGPKLKAVIREVFSAELGLQFDIQVVGNEQQLMLRAPPAKSAAFGQLLGGDVLVRVNGVQVAGPGALRAALAGNPQRAKVEVLRAARPVTVEFALQRSGPTQRQLEAIEIALNTPDVCLIQGPPGTGKTKVIEAIQACIAVLVEEGSEPSHRILATSAQHDAVENLVKRTKIFGVPGQKVGKRRRGVDAAVDQTLVFVEEVAEQLRATTRGVPEAERLSKARNIALACIRTRSLPSIQSDYIRELVRVLDGLLPPKLRDKALERATGLERPTGTGDPEEAEKLLNAARGIRVEHGAFSDDGPVKARIALQRLAAILTDEERAFLERCAATDQQSLPPRLDEGRLLRNALIDRLAQQPCAAEPGLAEATQHLLLEIVDGVELRLATTRAGEEAALAAYLNDLESDPEGVHKALEHYTVVLAATLQQAAGNEMRRVRSIDEGQTTFESVIVDEAARAHPLDLFIPLSMASRRVVLVGDHRQLPHLLEPDVERQLSEGVDQGSVDKQTLDAVKASLFERMWVLLRALEQRDGIRRTVTLNAQYRMHPVLGGFVSRAFYEIHDDGEIESPLSADQFSHDLPGYVQNGTARVAAWLDVPCESGNEVRGISKRRPAEARAIAKEVRRLIDHDPRLTFGVISFYSDQVNEIGEAMVKEGLTERANNERGWRIAEAWSTTYNREGKKVERLRVGTVDAFQGKEFDVVLLSVTRSNDLAGRTDEEQRRKYGHLMLENRLCVAMSRQQRLLIAVGDLAFVQAEEARKPLRALRAFSDLCGGEHGVAR